jgi:uncharacterized protein (TIGR02453 family)
MPNKTNPRFPEAGLRFLRALKRHNDRKWFIPRKHIYEESVRAPMVALVEALAERFGDFAPEIIASPRTSLYRIYRDTRFTKDKSPYKTHVAAVFPLRGVGRHEGAGFYFHIAPTEVLVGGGLYRPLPDELRAVRLHIAEKYETLESIAGNRKFMRLFGSLQGEQLARVPRAFHADHPAADYLRYRQFLASRQLPPEQASTPRFLDVLARTFEALHPLISFLNEPILEHREAKSLESALLRY